MPRHRLVQVQRLHLPRVARGQVVGVVVEHAGPRAVRRALLVRAAGIGLLACNAGTGRISSGALGDQRELLADPRIDALADRVVAVAQLVADFGLNCVIGAQEVEELGSVPLKPTFAFCASISFRMRATSDRPSLWTCVRRQRQRRVRSRSDRRRAVAPPGIADRPTLSRAAGRYVVRQEIAHPLVRGDEHVAHLRAHRRRAAAPGRPPGSSSGNFFTGAVEGRSLDALARSGCRTARSCCARPAWAGRRRVFMPSRKRTIARSSCAAYCALRLRLFS